MMMSIAEIHERPALFFCVVATEGIPFDIKTLSSLPLTELKTEY
jgi:hypothetical protein